MKRRPLDGITVLTTDAEKRIGLYAVRYLGRAGGRVTTVAETDGARTPLAFLSRYAAACVALPPAGFRKELKAFYRDHAREFQLVNPIDIAQMLCLIDADREYALGCTYLLPKRESLVTADNKELLGRHAAETGLSCPRTFTQIDPADAHALGNAGLTFPAIIKFRGDERSTHWRPEERYAIVRTPEELDREYRRMHAIEPFPVVQEFIRGAGFGYFALYDRKRRLRAQFCHRRIREYPVQGGPSSCCEGIHDEDLAAAGRRLLESLEWTGLAMVEFKFDEARQKYTIIEVNPRYWGSLPLAVESGVNFPVLHALSALERPYEPVLRYRAGIRVRFLDRDVKAVLSLVRAERRLSQRLKLLLGLLDPAAREGFVSLDDPGPLLGRLFSRRPRRPSSRADR